MTTYSAIKMLINEKLVTVEMVEKMVLEAYGRYINGRELIELVELAKDTLEE